MALLNVNEEQFVPLAQNNREKTMTTATRNRIKNVQKYLTVVLLTISIFTFTEVVNANGRKNVQMNATIEISSTGDADVDFNMEMPLREYTMVKGQFGNAQYLGRMMSNSLAWSEIKGLSGQFVDAENTVNARMTHVGYAKPYKPGKWEIDLSTEGLTLVAITGNTAHFSAAMDTPFGATNVICRLQLPDGSTNHDYNEDKGMLRYDFVPAFEEGEDGDVEFELDTKVKLMSSLAKIYGNEKFDNFWVARSKFQNSGDQVISNLKMRHRIAGMSSWSGWKKTKIVYPGQTVIEPFFPVLDIEKLAGFTSTQNAMVEVEYSYSMGGEKHTDTDSSKLQVLARNEVEWSSYHIDEVTNFYELFDNCPQIYGAFANSNDPVVQQVSATISRMINGTAPMTDEAAWLYLQATWKFMEVNRVAYQLPPGTSIDGKMTQHLKYARDVMRNKAGTCADLAVFWASVGKAAGMEAVICGVPGHAFPAFILPESKQLMAIESTAILSGSFEDAVKSGMATLGKYTQEGTIIQVNIDEIRSKGVHCLDLPAVETDFLQKLGYELDLQLVTEQKAEQGQQESSQQQHEQSQKSEQTEPRGSRERTRRAERSNRPRALQGIWRSEVAIGGGTVVVVAAFDGDGECQCLSRVYDGYGSIVSDEEDGGTWEADGSTIYTESVFDGLSYEYPYRFQNGQLIITIEGNEFPFTKNN